MNRDHRSARGCDVQHLFLAITLGPACPFHPFLRLAAALLCCLFMADMAIATDKQPVIAWIDSYNTGYAWSDGIGQGIRKGLEGADVKLVILHMDTKEMQGEPNLRAAGRKARAFIKRNAADVVIASDDNAQQYLVAPYLLNSDIPVVFCGVNAEPQDYGYPAANVTGMLEVEPLEVLHWHLQRLTHGERVGYISGDVPTDRTVVEKYNRQHFQGKLQTYLARDFEEFKELYLRAQQEVDMLLFMNNGGIQDWSDQAAREFIFSSTRIPTGTVAPYLKQFCMITLGKDPVEQGEYAARAALQLLQGASAGDMPLARNERVLMTLNIGLASAAGLLFPLTTLEAATEVLQGGD